MDVLVKIIRNGGIVTRQPFPTPASIQWEISTTDALTSGRSPSDIMFRDVIDDKRKLQVSWPPMSDAEISAVLQKLDDPFFFLEFPDAHDGTRREMECYVGNRPAPLYAYDENSGEWKWGSMQVSFIER